MRVIEQNEGPKVQYTIDGSKIIFLFNAEKLELDLEAEQEDVQKIIDLCLGEEGNLIRGVGKWYVANVVIPPREYETVESENGEQTITALPVNMDKVVLILWVLPEGGRQ